MSPLSLFVHAQLDLKQAESLLEWLKQENLYEFLDNLLAEFIAQPSDKKLAQVLQQVHFLCGVLQEKTRNQNSYKSNLSETVDTEVTASLRAPKGYHIPEILTDIAEQYPDYLLRFGGHPSAAGFTAKEKYLTQIQQEFEKRIKQQTEKLEQEKNFVVDQEAQSLLEQLTPKERIPLQQYLKQSQTLFIPIKELTLDFVKQIESLDPFGQDFPWPELLVYATFREMSSLSSSWRWLEKSECLKGNINDLSLTIFRPDKENQEKIKRWLSLTDKGKLESIMQEKKVTSTVGEVQTPIKHFYFLVRATQNTWQNQKTEWQLVGNKMWLF